MEGYILVVLIVKEEELPELIFGGLEEFSQHMKRQVIQALDDDGARTEVEAALEKYKKLRENKEEGSEYLFVPAFLSCNDRIVERYHVPEEMKIIARSETILLIPNVSESIM